MKIKLILLISLICFAIILRFWGLEKRGLFSQDEGYYFLGAKTLAAATNYMKMKLLSNAEEKSKLPPFNHFLRSEGGDYPVGAKHGFYAIATVGLLILGIKDYAILYNSAFFGVVSVLLVYVIAQRVFSWSAAFFATLLLVISPFHITYSRSAYPHVTAVFFVLLATYLYLKTINGRSNKFLILSGLCLGYAVSCHPNQLWILSILLLDFLVFKKIKRITYLFLGFCFPLLLFQFLSLGGIYLAKVVGWKSPEEINSIIISYFRQMRIQFTTASEVPSRFIDLLFYLYLLFRFEGIAVLGFLLVGILSIIVRARHKFDYPAIFILFLAIFPFILWSVYVNKAARTLLSVIPFIFILAGEGVRSLLEWLKWHAMERLRIFVAIAVTIFFIFWGINISLDTIKARSAYPEAVHFLIKNGNLRHFTSCSTLSACYIPGSYKNVYVREDVTLAKAKELFKNEGFRYIILDYSRYTINNGELINFINTHALSPVFRLKSKPFDLFAYDAVMAIHRQKTKDVDAIEVYDLVEVFDKVKE